MGEPAGGVGERSLLAVIGYHPVGWGRVRAKRQIKG